MRNKRTYDQRLADKALISELYLQGLYQSAIASHISKIRPYTLTQQQISKDIKALRREWIETYTDNFDKHISQSIAQIDLLISKAFEALERSAEPEVKEITTARQSNNPALILRDDVGQVIPNSVSQTRQSTTNSTSAALIGQIRQLIESKVKILAAWNETRNAANDDGETVLKPPVMFYLPKHEIDT